MCFLCFPFLFLDGTRFHDYLLQYALISISKGGINGQNGGERASRLQIFHNLAL